MSEKPVTAERKALEAIWPFMEHELGQIVTPGYAEAIKKVAQALGKTVVLEQRGTSYMPPMFYVKEIQS